jgi:hypothetical protein
MRKRWLAVAAGTLALLLPASVQAQLDLKIYNTKYYILKTDVNRDQVREIEQRLTLMAEEYDQRTRGFAGTVRDRLPVFVFRRAEDYYANGGVRGSGGAFTGDRLMVLAGDNLTPETWHRVQHEGFHQFALAAIGRGLPPWANEGLAEYFGEGLFTGDNFFTGVIPPERLARLKQAIQDDKVRTLVAMMSLAPETWNAEIGLAHQKAGQNYDQAWSMIQFLAHAENGRYQDPFARFLSDVSRGRPWEQAWLRAFGNAVDAFEKRWKEYWLSLPERPSDELYARATAATLTSFFARAFSQRQYFDSFDEFAAAAKAGELKAAPEDRLPAALLEEALAKAPAAGDWSVAKKPGKKLLVCTRDDGSVLEGQFRVENHRVKWIEVIVRPAKRKQK